MVSGLACTIAEKGKGLLDITHQMQQDVFSKSRHARHSQSWMPRETSRRQKRQVSSCGHVLSLLYVVCCLRIIDASAMTAAAQAGTLHRHRCHFANASAFRGSNLKFQVQCSMRRVWQYYLEAVIEAELLGFASSMWIVIMRLTLRHQHVVQNARRIQQRASRCSEPWNMEWAWR